MAKSAEAFRSIGEVARLIGVAPHVLRYWETQFTQLSPMKRPDGRRYYRPADIDLAAGICALLRDDGMTIRGARKIIAADRGATLRQRGAQILADIPAAQPAPMLDLDMPEPAPLPAPTLPWLARLTRLARILRAEGGRSPKARAARPAVVRLAHAMLDLS